MQIVTGAGTGWEPVVAMEPSPKVDNDHIWEILFAYRGPDSVRDVMFGGRTQSSLALRSYLLGKQQDADRAWSSGEVEGERCVFCRHTFGATYIDSLFGSITIRRNSRNRYYCNQCDFFIRMCPGQTILDMPVLVVDVWHSKEIRRQVGDLSQYSRLLLRFRRRVMAEIQRNLGFVMNTIGDAVLAVWPSGFVPDDVRERLELEPERPARIPAILATRAAQSLAGLAPKDFDGIDVPFRGVVDTTEMAIFSVATIDPEEQQVFLAQPEGATADLVAGPGDAEDERTVAVDVAGEAVEVAAGISSHEEALAGRMYVTRRTDIAAGSETDRRDYDSFEGISVETRAVG